jgi:hypothetical protein
MSIPTILGAVWFLGVAPAPQTPFPVSLHAETALNEAMGGRAVHLSPAESRALLTRLVNDAQACILQKVGDDPSFRDALHGGRVGDLIVAAFQPCWPAVDALITAHDRHFGSGSGESFVTGPFLDDIPRVIERRLR